MRRKGKGKTTVAVFANKNLQTIYQADRTWSKAHWRQWAGDQVLIQLLKLIHLWTDNCIFRLHIYLCLTAQCSQVLNPSKERDSTPVLISVSLLGLLHDGKQYIQCNTTYYKQYNTILDIWNCNSFFILFLKITLKQSYFIMLNKRKINTKTTNKQKTHHNKRKPKKELRNWSR